MHRAIPLRAPVRRPFGRYRGAEVDGRMSHEMPYPHNIQLALRLEGSSEPRPATIGIIGGEIVVGLDRGQIEHLATAEDVRKVSRRDLPIVVARKLDGATTVATTSWAAHRAGIQVFAHGRHRRGAQNRNQESGARNRNLTEEQPATSFQLPASSFQFPIHRHLGRFAGAGADAHHRGVRRHEGDPRPARDAGMAGDARGDGGRLRHQRIAFPRVLQPGQRPAGGRDHGKPV